MITRWSLCCRAVLHNSNLMGRSIAATQPPAAVLCEVRGPSSLTQARRCSRCQRSSRPLLIRGAHRVVTPQVRVLATNFGPVSSASAPSIRGFFQQAPQTANLTSASTVRDSTLIHRSTAGTDVRAGCLLPAPDLPNPTPCQPQTNPVVTARAGMAVEEPSAPHAKPLDKSTALAEDETIVSRVLTMVTRKPTVADIDLGGISVAEQASILADIQRRAHTHSTAAPSSKASGKRSRQGFDALQGQEAQSALQQPDSKQRRISDVFKRVQHPQGGQRAK